MSSVSKVGGSAAARKNDHVSLCLFTFSDGRRCRTPRTGNHPHFCFDHAQKEAHARTAESIGKDLAYFFSADYLSANDLSAALARLIPAVVRGDIKPKTARTVAYLAQTLLQSIRLAQHEYINAFGTNGWRNAIFHSVNGNHDYLFPPAPASPVVAGLQTGAVHAPQPLSSTPHTQVPQPTAAPSQTQPLRPVSGPASTPPQPTAAPLGCHSERSEESAVSPAPQAPASTTNATPPISATQPAPAVPPTAQPNNPPPPPPPPPAKKWDPYGIDFPPNCRLLIDGKPWDGKPL
jgi:hypothetical protein